MKIRLSLLVLLFSVSFAAYGQGGCVDSPECSTAVLGAVGIAAMVVVRRFKR